MSNTHNLQVIIDAIGSYVNNNKDKTITFDEEDIPFIKSFEELRQLTFKGGIDFAGEVGLTLGLFRSKEFKDICERPGLIKKMLIVDAKGGEERKYLLGQLLIRVLPRMGCTEHMRIGTENKDTGFDVLTGHTEERLGFHRDRIRRYKAYTLPALLAIARELEVEGKFEEKTRPPVYEDNLAGRWENISRFLLDQKPDNIAEILRVSGYTTIEMIGQVQWWMENVLKCKSEEGVGIEWHHHKIPFIPEKTRGKVGTKKIYTVPETYSNLDSLVNFILDEHLLLDEWFGHMVIDRAHLEALVYADYPEYQFRDGQKAKMRDIIMALCEKVQRDPKKYPEAFEQLKLRLWRVEDDLFRRGFGFGPTTVAPLQAPIAEKGAGAAMGGSIDDLPFAAETQFVPPEPDFGDGSGVPAPPPDSMPAELSLESSADSAMPAPPPSPLQEEAVRSTSVSSSYELNSEPSVARTETSYTAVFQPLTDASSTPITYLHKIVRYPNLKELTNAINDFKVDPSNPPPAITDDEGELLKRCLEPWAEKFNDDSIGFSGIIGAALGFFRSSEFKKICQHPGLIKKILVAESKGDTSQTKMGDMDITLGSLLKMALVGMCSTRYMEIGTENKKLDDWGSTYEERLKLHQDRITKYEENTFPALWAIASAFDVKIAFEQEAPPTRNENNLPDRWQNITNFLRSRTPNDIAEIVKVRGSSTTFIMDGVKGYMEYQLGCTPKEGQEKVSYHNSLPLSMDAGREGEVIGAVPEVIVPEQYKSVDELVDYILKERLLLDDLFGHAIADRAHLEALV